MGIRRKYLNWRYILVGAATSLPLALGATLITGGVWYLLRIFDPRLQVIMIGVTYDRELHTLVFVFLSAGLLTTGYRLFNRRSTADLTVGTLIWRVILAELTSFRFPGFGSVFVLPVFCTRILLSAALFASNGSRWARTFFLALGAAGIILVLTPVVNFMGIFSVRAEILIKLPMIAVMPALFTALTCALLLPVFDEISLNRRGIAASVMAGLTFLGLLSITITARFTDDRPKPNMVAYMMNADTGEAYWITGADSVAVKRRSLVFRQMDI
jgi:hypothetical protein